MEIARLCVNLVESAAGNCGNSGPELSKHTPENMETQSWNWGKDVGLHAKAYRVIESLFGEPLKSICYDRLGCRKGRPFRRDAALVCVNLVYTHGWITSWIHFSATFSAFCLRLFVYHLASS